MTPREIIASHQIRTGDIVLHHPSGEEWVVAWADHQSGYMAPCGWPTCQAKIEDCAIIKAVDDAASDKMVDELSRSGRTDAHRANAIRALAKEKQGC